MCVDNKIATSVHQDRDIVMQLPVLFIAEVLGKSIEEHAPV